PLYRNDGHLSLSEVSFQARVAGPTIPFLGWGAGFLDFDNDGLLDIFVANGHIYPWVDTKNWGTTWAQRPLLFHNLDGNKFAEVPAATGSGLAEVIPSRGAAFGDLFNHGRMDVLLNNIDSAPTFLHNVVKTNNHWISLKLIGGQSSPRDAVGAKVFLSSNGARQRADVTSGGSYGSSSDLRVHFGLGQTTKVDKIEIYWPSGRIEMVNTNTCDRMLTVVEGKGIVDQ
ncbi:MAG: CRTAC1 family protein, partial [Acidobacteria bacterium]|nr:CRTAC1 family protein [Acidobacteriota bacterium]